MAIGIFKFIDVNNHDQIVWATKYLMKKNLISVSAREQITAQTLDRALRSITNGPEALQMMESGGNYIATALNDPQYLGDVTIQVAREAAAGEEVPSFVDAGTALVTPENVGEFPHDALFAEYRPEVLAK